MHPIVNIALSAARRAGKIITRSADRVEAFHIEEKSKNDLVSDVDRQAEAAIIETIQKAYPEHAILGEEGGAIDTDSEFTWVIDPLDGTTNFLRGIPHHCTSIGVKRGGTLMHGVIVDHFRNEEFTATRGEGAQMNGRRLRVSATDKLDTAVLVVGMPFAAAKAHGDAFAQMIHRFGPQVRALRRTGSAALDLAYVAAGRFDGLVEIGMHEWDTAAGVVIVREAGGFVGDVAGGDRFVATGNIIAANSKIFRPMLRVIKTTVEETKDLLLAKG